MWFSENVCCDAKQDEHEGSIFASSASRIKSSELFYSEADLTSVPFFLDLRGRGRQENARDDDGDEATLFLSAVARRTTDDAAPARAHESCEEMDDGHARCAAGATALQPSRQSGGNRLSTALKQKLLALKLEAEGLDALYSRQEEDTKGEERKTFHEIIRDRGTNQSVRLRAHGVSLQYQIADAEKEFAKQKLSENKPYALAYVEVQRSAADGLGGAERVRSIMEMIVQVRVHLCQRPF